MSDPTTSSGPTPAVPDVPFDEQPIGTEPAGRFERRQWIGLVLGPALFLLLWALPVPAGLEAAAWRTAAVGALMAVWWITEAIPIPATALLPLVLFPVLGIGGIREAAAPYANPLVFLFMGGFMLALGMQRWGLHRRIALNIIRRIGTRPRSIVAGFMIATALLSMWVSNTATAMMMLPIGLSVIELVRPGRTAAEAVADGQPFAVALMLGIAYAASIGGLGTTIGTPTNAFMVGFMDEAYGYQIGFAQWMLVGLPIVLVGIPLAFWVLTRLVFPVKIDTLPGGRRLIEAELEQLGPIGRGEALVAGVFGAVALLWITRPLLAGLVPGLSDAGIAMLGAVLLFLLPVDLPRGVFVLNWRTAEELPWGVLILFGGGLSLAAAINDTGLAAWIGAALGGIGSWPAWLVLLVITSVVIFLTELTSNVATAAAFLPILASAATGLGENPLLFVVPAAIASSCAFMLPVATPPNAIVYGSGVLTVPQMARAGIWLNVLFVLLAVGVTYTLAGVVFDMDLGTVPSWAR